jgi:malonyl-CoA O-methyltransferase
MLTRVRQFLFRVPELAPREAYRLWADNYPPYAHNLLMHVEERAVCELLPTVRGKRVLDLASGTGRYARLMHEQGARVTALDFSYEMLTRGETRFARIQADMNALPLRAASVEVIVCGLAVGHVASLQGALQEMVRILKPKGTLVYSDFHAATRNWKRTFRAANKTFAVQHHARTEQEHTRAIRDVGLLLDTLRVVHVTPELAHIDARAEDFRARWGDTPVALVVRAQKP